jgi:hypothetical protein
MSFDLKRVLNTLDEFGPTFQKANEVDPSTFKSAGEGLAVQPSLGFLSDEDRLYVKRSLHRLSDDELGTLLTKAMIAGSGKGRPADASIFEAASLNGDPSVQKALDTTTGSALQRTDLDPIIQELTANSSLGW